MSNANNPSRAAIAAALDSVTSRLSVAHLPLTMGALDAHVKTNFTAAIDSLNDYVSDAKVIKARYADLRSTISSAFRSAAHKIVQGAYLSGGQPEWATDVYYGGTDMNGIKKAKSISLKYAGKEPMADSFIAFYNEWEPVVAALNSLKSKITTTTAVREEKKVAETKARAMIPPTKLSMIVSAAVDAHKPELEKMYREFVTRQYAYAVEKFGSELKGIFSDRSWARTYENTLSPVLTHGKINSAALDEKAKEYASSVAESMRGKIMSKAGEIDNPAIQYMAGYNFVLTGEFQGKPVHIEQSMIVNQSKLGTLYNQFPARIYLGGRSVSEAQFKTMQLKK